MKRPLLPLLFLLSGSTAAYAHFVFVVPDPGHKTASVFINEELRPSSEVDVSLIGGAKLRLRKADGMEIPLTLVRSGNVYTIELADTSALVVHGMVDLGMAQPGAKPNVLMYYPKTILGNPFDSRTLVGGDAPVELVPVGKPGATIFKLLVHGKPQADAEITVILPDGSQTKVKTDKSGQTPPFDQIGRFGAWARYWEPSAGERDGKKYEELHHYATLVFDEPSDAAKHADLTASRFATLPQATSSFGAVIADGWLYVYGGHIARTHSYSTASVSGRFDRLRLADKSKWKSLPAGPALQGMNLAAYGGKIYRIGGMEPRNKPGEKEAIYSIADCARFDPAAGKWEPLPPLPQPRSSHDVAVVGDKLIVTGGWTLRGAEPTQWPETAEVLDLAAKDPQWKSVAQPFKRRAMIASAHAGKVYVLGGFDEKSEVVNHVSVYDPSKDTWTSAPDLPGTGTNTFAPAACEHAGRLYVSVADGTVYLLDESNHWVPKGTATPRIAHRMVSYEKGLLVIGGAADGNNSDLVESVVLDR